MLFFGVAWHGSEAESRAYIEEFDVPYSSGLDRDEKIFTAYGFNYQPATVFVTRSGRILRSHFGSFDRAELEEMVRKLMDA